MAIVEFKGGRITHRYLMNKTKDDLARMYMELLKHAEKLEQRLEAANSAALKAEKDARRYRWLADCAGIEFEQMFGYQMTGRMGEAIDKALEE